MKPTSADAGDLDTLSEVRVGATGPMLGTPMYMSPEQIRGERVDIRSDIHALGLVVFEVFAGEPAYRADSTEGTLWRILSDEVDVCG